MKRSTTRKYGSGKRSTSRKIRNDVHTCNICQQPLSDVICFTTRQGSNVEPELLTNPRLKFMTSYSGGGEEEDEVPVLEINQFYITDDCDHLVCFDDGLLEDGHTLFLYGSIKTLPEPSENDLPETKVDKIGPIVKWWFTGINQSDDAVIAVETSYAAYILLSPQESYEPFVQVPIKKVTLCKIVVEFLSEHPEANYNDLLDEIQEKSGDDDETLMKHANFILEQVISYDETNSGHDRHHKLLGTSALRQFVSLCGLPPKSKNQNYSKIGRRDKRRICDSDTFAITTPTVRSFFNQMFHKTFEEDSRTQSRVSVETRDISACKHKLCWTSDSVPDEVSGRKYYTSLSFDNTTISVGDFVSFRAKNNLVSYGQVKWFYEVSRKKILHVLRLLEGSQTILGNASYGQEVFLVKQCFDVEAIELVSKVNVSIGCQARSEPQSFVCSKLYCLKKGSFRDFDATFLSTEGNCFCCLDTNREQNLAVTNSDSIEINGLSFRVNDYVILSPQAFIIQDFLQEYYESHKIPENCSYDETLYPEKYRKAFNPPKGSYSTLSPLYNIGLIQEIIQDKNLCGYPRVKIKKCYRPQNYWKSFEEIVEKDAQELYASSDVIIVASSTLKGKLYSIDLEKIDQMNEPYFVIKREIDPESKELQGIREPIALSLRIPEEEEKGPKDRLLQTLDIFSGCGGLALGFHEAGICDTKWAIEKDQQAAEAFKKNFPAALVYQEDANAVLKKVLELGDTRSSTGPRFPQKGQVDLILAGPPCQGFSEMNRFSSGSYSQFKNSLVTTLLGFVDHFRPKYLLIENVRNFLKFHRGMVFKLTLSCLLQMGYQVAFSVLQAGFYGVPQSRNRAFITASLPGHRLPEFPPVLTAFPLNFYQSTILVDNKRFTINQEPVALYRQITVWDSISDLPPQVEQDSNQEINYTSPPLTNFQKRMRIKSDLLQNHVSRPLSHLNQARVERIPLTRGADWRDLPNISLNLKSGVHVRKLEYLFKDDQTGKVSRVCNCSDVDCEGRIFRQESTLIPWCLAHTASRNYQWSGSFGRLHWDEFFSTAVTIPDPSGKQGRVIHPTQHRVLSVREAARSQGFPDHVSFCGSLSDCYRQVGNAVPPPLAMALAIQFKHALL